MKINELYNYCILSNNINKKLLNIFKDYPNIEQLEYNKLVEKLEFFKSKRIVFNETFYYLKEEEKKKIIDLLNTQKIKFIIITSNIEDALYADYIAIYDNDNIAIEGEKRSVLNEEKILKRLGFGLPFIVDLSTQLKIYECIDNIYYDSNSLAGELWK